MEHGQESHSMSAHETAHTLFSSATEALPLPSSLAVKYTTPSNFSQRPLTIAYPIPLLPPVTWKGLETPLSNYCILHLCEWILNNWVKTQMLLVSSPLDTADSNTYHSDPSTRHRCCFPSIQMASASGVTCSLAINFRLEEASHREMSILNDGEVGRKNINHLIARVTTKGNCSNFGTSRVNTL